MDPRKFTEKSLLALEASQNEATQAKHSDYQYSSIASTRGSRKWSYSTIVGKDGDCLAHFSDAACTEVRCVTTLSGSSTTQVVAQAN